MAVKARQDWTFDVSGPDGRIAMLESLARGIPTPPPIMLYFVWSKIEYASKRTLILVVRSTSSVHVKTMSSPGILGT